MQGTTTSMPLSSTTSEACNGNPIAQGWPPLSCRRRGRQNLSSSQSEGEIAWKRTWRMGKQHRGLISHRNSFGAIYLANLTLTQVDQLASSQASPAHRLVTIHGDIIVLGDGPENHIGLIHFLYSLYISTRSPSDRSIRSSSRCVKPHK
jgi:hypothetical protein